MYTCILCSANVLQQGYSGVQCIHECCFCVEWSQYTCLPTRQRQCSAQYVQDDARTHFSSVREYLRASTVQYSRYHTQTGTCTYIALSLLKWTRVLPAHYTETTHSNATTQAVPVYTCSISSRVDMSRTQYTGHLYMSSVLQDTTNRSLVQLYMYM